MQKRRRVEAEARETYAETAPPELPKAARIWLSSADVCDGAVRRVLDGPSRGDFCGWLVQPRISLRRSFRR